MLQGTLAGGVNQAGAIRGIKPKLHEGVQIDVLVPSYSWGVDCVHNGGLLSFEHGEGKLVPLIGTAEPAAAAAPARSTEANFVQSRLAVIGARKSAHYFCGAFGVFWLGFFWSGG